VFVLSHEYFDLVHKDKSNKLNHKTIKKKKGVGGI
jgi:hypothetical protein